LVVKIRGTVARGRKRDGAVKNRASAVPAGVKGSVVKNKAVMDRAVTKGLIGVRVVEMGSARDRKPVSVGKSAAVVLAAKKGSVGKNRAVVGLAVVKGLTAKIRGVVAPVVTRDSARSAVRGLGRVSMKDLIGVRVAEMGSVRDRKLVSVGKNATVVPVVVKGLTAKIRVVVAPVATKDSARSVVRGLGRVSMRDLIGVRVVEKDSVHDRKLVSVGKSAAVGLVVVKGLTAKIRGVVAPVATRDSARSVVRGLGRVRMKDLVVVRTRDLGRIRKKTSVHNGVKDLIGARVVEKGLARSVVKA
jgi:hypothetical protein